MKRLLLCLSLTSCQTVKDRFDLWFAGQALAGRLSHLGTEAQAEYCYRLADAMLAARNQNTKNP